MKYENLNVDNNDIVIGKYTNIDTNEEHNLLIYKYNIDNSSNSIVLAELIGQNDLNINLEEKYSDLILFIKQNITYRLSNSLLLFVWSLINQANNKNLFDDVKFSKDGYDLLFSYERNIQSQLNTKLKSIAIDPLTKIFSSIGNDLEAFHDLEYYENLINEDSKVLKKAINM